MSEEKQDKGLDGMLEAFNEAVGKVVEDYLDKNAGCAWCHPDERGQYSAAAFVNPNGKEKIVMFFNGAQATLTFEAEGAEVAHMAAPINFCPMCGRRVRMEAE